MKPGQSSLIEKYVTLGVIAALGGVLAQALSSRAVSSQAGRVALTAGLAGAAAAGGLYAAQAVADMAQGEKVSTPKPAAVVSAALSSAVVAGIASLLVSRGGQKLKQPARLAIVGVSAALGALGSQQLVGLLKQAEGEIEKVL